MIKQKIRLTGKKKAAKRGNANSIKFDCEMTGIGNGSLSQVTTLKQIARRAEELLNCSDYTGLSWGHSDRS